MIKLEIDDSPMSIIYINALYRIYNEISIYYYYFFFFRYNLYYALITCSTVGYGDISPTTSNEKIYGIFMTIISCGVFAYAVNTIGSIF